MSSHLTSAKPRSFKCRHFYFLFDTHNYCPTCRESGKVDDPCVTNQSPFNICASCSEEQQIKIKHRRRYIRNTSKEDDLDLLGYDVEAFSGSQANLEGATEILHLPSPTPTFGIFILKDSTNCPTHPRYCIVEQNRESTRKIPG